MLDTRCYTSNQYPASSIKSRIFFLILRSDPTLMEDREKAIRELHEQIQKLAAQQKDVQQQILKLQNAVFELNIAENDRLNQRCMLSSYEVPNHALYESHVSPNPR